MFLCIPAWRQNAFLLWFHLSVIVKYHQHHRCHVGLCLIKRFFLSWCVRLYDSGGVCVWSVCIFPPHLCDALVLFVSTVTDEFMLPTPTTTHLLQQPHTALVPWWASILFFPSLCLSCPLSVTFPVYFLVVVVVFSSLHPSAWILVQLTPARLNLIEFVFCANGSWNATLILVVNVMNVLISWQCSAC